MLKAWLRPLYHRLIKPAPAPRQGEVPKRAIAQFLPPHPVIVEAGAHTGSDTVEMAALWPEATIHAFEPIPEVYTRLLEATQACTNVRCYPLALGNQVGTQSIFVSSGGSSASSSLLPPKDHLTEHPTTRFDEQLEIAIVTLDHWAEAQALARVDFLWLDMQGYELAALQAAPRMLQTVTAIYTEVMLKELYEGCPLYPEMRQWLAAAGFQVAQEELAWADAGNVLFVRQTEHG